MEVNGLDLERQKQSATTLGNAVEIVSGIITNIAGNDISNSLNGSRITNDLVQTLAAQRIGSNLEQKLKNI